MEDRLLIRMYNHTLPVSPRNGTPSSNYTLDDYKVLTPASILSITVYSVLLFFGLLGNLVVFLTLLKSRYRKSSRVNKLILHLAIADLIVCCFTIPIEIGWRVTVTWDAGDFLCRLLQFSRPFGLYLSSNTIICISLDRYFAIVQPLKLADARRRGRVMLLCSWIFAVFSSIPQAVIFRATLTEIAEFPGVIIPDCLSTGYFDDPVYEAAYSVCSICIMYVLPLVVTVGAYGRILWEISITRRLKATSQNNPDDPAARAFLAHEKSTLSPTTGYATHGGPRTTFDRSASFVSSNRLRQAATARQSDLSKIERARSRTLKLTVLIVGVFIICFTPYAVLVFWYQIDKESAANMDQRVQESLFLFAVSNSILNPYLYGIYSKNLRKEICRSFLWRAVRDFFSKNVCGDSSFSGLGRRWTKGTDCTKGPCPLDNQHPWTPPPSPLTAYKISASNRAPPIGPGPYSHPKRIPSRSEGFTTSKESYSVNFPGCPTLQGCGGGGHHHFGHHHRPPPPYGLPRACNEPSDGSSVGLVTNHRSRSNTATGAGRCALRGGSAVAVTKKAVKAANHRAKAKCRIGEDTVSAASSYD